VLEIIEALRRGESCKSLARKKPISLKAITNLSKRWRLLFMMGKRELDGELIDGQWPAVLDFDLNLIDEIISKRTNRNFFDGARVTFQLLTGLQISKCGYCGRSMKTHSITQKNDQRRKVTRWTYYRCWHSVVKCPTRRLRRADLIDGLVLADCQKRIAEIATHRAEWNIWRKKSNPEKLKAKLEKTLENLKSRKTRLINAIEGGVITLAEAGPRMKTIKTEISICEKKLSQLKKPPDEFPWNNLEGMIITDLDLIARKHFLKSILDRIDFAADTLTLTYSITTRTGDPFQTQIPLPN